MKTLIQDKIDNGEISNFEELSDLVAQLNLEVIRNGADYLGLLHKTGKRFRVRFSFPNPTRSPTKKSKPADQQKISSAKFCRSETGCWIYALLAYDRSTKKKACYIGQTVNLKRRFREHLYQNRVGRGSYHLTQWAKAANTEIYGAVLAWTDKGQSVSTYMEGHWLQIAIKAGFEVPGSENWGKLPTEISQKWGPAIWAEEEIQTLSLPLTEIIENGTMPVMLIGEADIT